MTTAKPQAGVEPRPPAAARFWNWLFEDRTRAIFTIITFAAMIGGLVFEALLDRPDTGFALYIIAYLTGGIYGVHAGITALLDRRIDVDMLMVLAALGALIVGSPFEGAMLLFLFSLSNVLQSFALQRTSHAIEALMEYRPDTALVRRSGSYESIPIEEVRIGERIVIRPGERIPLDGVVQSGSSSVDQSSLTGESLPIQKEIGDDLFAGTINMHGSLEMNVSRLAKDSAIEKLIEMVSEAQGRKARTQDVIERIEQYYALGVILVTIGLILVPITFFGSEFNTAFYRAMGVMVAASPCAVVISTPATVLSAIGNAARRGVLFKGGIHVERAADIKVVAFDKTGTLTIGRPQVSEILLPKHSGAGVQRAEEVLAIAASVERKSEHPLAQSIVAEAKRRDLPLADVDGFQAEPGKGVRGRIEGRWIHAGSPKYIRDTLGFRNSEMSEEIAALQAEGKTCVVVGADSGILGLVAISDTLRSGTREVVAQLKERGIEHTVMLTGDNERAARFIADKAGLDDYRADLLPEEKLKIIGELEAAYGPVLMVGDGVNDAPALAAASLGMAMGAAGTDVALETADIVLMGEDLTRIPYVTALSRKTRATLKQNLVFAFGVIFVLVGAVLGFELPLPLSVIGHEGSTVLVSLNGLRLLGFKG